ncbi:MAG: hypothetical protein PHV32_19455 [Eubacteriales bacterium]|nr:hypothetical protein [Eubacteriales bacterium]
MCFYAIPVGALEELGELITANNSSDINNEVKPDTEEEFVTDAIGEMTNLREANTKHFRMTDGLYVAMMYDQTVRYRNVQKTI